MSVRKSIVRIGNILVITGVALVVLSVLIGVIQPMFVDNLLPVDGIDLSKIFPWILTNAFLVLFDAESNPLEKMLSAGILLIAMAICFYLVAAAAGLFTKSKPEPVTVPDANDPAVVPPHDQ